MAEKKKKLFSLRQPEQVTIRIPMKDDDGVSYELVHVMRPPNAEDRKNYMRLLSYTEYDEDGKPRVVSDSGEAMERLYNDCALSIDGYGDYEGDEWKKLIPLSHKIMVVNLLLRDAGRLSGLPVKN